MSVTELVFPHDDIGNLTREVDRATSAEGPIETRTPKLNLALEFLELDEAAAAFTSPVNAVTR